MYNVISIQFAAFHKCIPFNFGLTITHLKTDTQESQIIYIYQPTKLSGLKPVVAYASARWGHIHYFPSVGLCVTLPKKKKKFYTRIWESFAVEHIPVPLITVYETGR